ncbi:MAG: hypothetical protein QXZ15_07485 [Candidatus Nitrosocaldaceae archaeon]
MKNRVMSLAIAALLVTSTFAAVMPIQKSYAEVSIETSNNTFFGPSMVRVLIIDTALRGDPSDTITVNVDAEGETGSIQVKEIGTSGQFELYIAAHTNANPASPTQLDMDDVSVVRIFSGATSANNANDDQPIVTGISTDLEDGDEIELTYTGSSKTIRFEASDASLSVDRTTAGNENIIKLKLTDQDANLDPTTKDRFDASVGSIVSPSLDFASGAVWEETGSNTGIFELSVGVNIMKSAKLSVASFPSSAIFEIRDHDVYDIYANAVAPYNDRDATTRTITKTVDLKNSDGSITLQAPLTIGNGFQIKIVDADRNVDSGERDIFDTNIFGTGTVRFKETSNNSGEFLVDLTNNRVPIVIGSPTGFDNTNKQFIVSISDIASDRDFTLTYNDPNADPQGSDSFSIARKIQHEAGTIETSTPSLPVTGKAKITIKDNDLNGNAFRGDSHTISLISSGGELVGDVGNGLGTLTISVVGKSISGVATNILLTEVDTAGNSADNTGIFSGEFRLDTIANILEDGDKVKFEYEDNTEDPTTTRSVEISIGRPSGEVEVDRASYPPESKVYVKITDTSMNTNVNREDTLDLTSRITITATKGTSSVSISPPTTASETDVNTGVFEFNFKLPSSVGDNWQVRITYRDSNGDDRSKTFNVLTTTAEISTDKQLYALGNNVKLTIVEPDWNTDSDKRDEISPSTILVRTDKLGWTPLDAAGISLDPSNLRETDKNSGIFEITLKEINEQFVSRGGRIEFRYNDNTPTGGGNNVRVETRVNVITGIPEIIFDKEVYTPFEEVCISIVDSSANIKSDAKDRIGTSGSSVTITVSGMNGNDETLEFEETEVNSGVFMYKGNECIQLDARRWSNGNTNTNDAILPAARDKAIRVEYETADGDIRLTKSALIVFNDGTVSFDKTSYRVGDTAMITVVDPDENINQDLRDSIEINVWSSSDRAGVTAILRETGDKTGVFTGTILLSSDASTGTRLQVRDGDTITARYTDRTLPDPADYNPDRDATISLETTRLDATATIGITKLPIERAPASPAVIVDDAGNRIEEIHVGMQVLISSEVTNNQTKSQDYILIFKVTNEDGETVKIGFTKGTLAANAKATGAIDWTPEKEGSYTIEVFVWESFENPIAISPKQETAVEVM